MTHKTRIDAETGCVIDQHSRSSVTVYLPESGVRVNTLSHAARARYGKDLRIDIAGAKDRTGDADAITVMLVAYEEIEALLDCADVMLDELDRLADLPPVPPKVRGQVDFERHDAQVAAQRRVHDLVDRLVINEDDDAPLAG